jgi:hypothetical protein
MSPLQTTVSEARKRMHQEPGLDRPRGLSVGIAGQLHDLELTTIQEDDVSDCDATLLRLPHYLISGSGLDHYNSERDIILFKRESCELEAKFIMEKVIGMRREGLIYGQGGTGKSSMVFFVSCSLRRHWNIIWVHTEPKISEAWVLIIQGGQVAKFSIRVVDMNFRSLPYHAQGGQCLVIVDCQDMADPHALELYSRAGDWVEQDYRNRLLLRVCSDEHLGSLPSQLLDKLAIHGVGSWSLEEYLTAIEDDEFWESVSGNLFDQDHSPTRDERKKIVESKFFYAGTCARFMFHYSVEAIKKTVFVALHSLGLDSKDPGSLIHALSKRYLVSQSLTGEFRIPSYSGFVSRYATIQIGLAVGTEMLQDLARYRQGYFNHDVRSWMFEALFLSRATDNRGVKLYSELEVRSGVVWRAHSEHWPLFVKFSPTRFDEKPDRLPYNIWLLPETPMQAGCDAVMLFWCSKAIRFVLTTIDTRCELNMAPLADLVTRMRNAGYTIQSAEICFIIPEDHYPTVLQIDPVEDLERFTSLFTVSGSDNLAVPRIETFLLPS